MNDLLQAACRLSRTAFLGTVSLCLSFASISLAEEATKLEFNRDIRPILSNHCFRCHGPDETTREAGLRLDLSTGAIAKLDSGGAAVVPGESAKSLLYHRITSTDANERMPPDDINKPLSPAQIKLLQQWIDQGAEYQGHWSFIAPVRREPPAVKQEKSVYNPVDRFILARVEKAGLTASPEASREALIRRVTFDLTGLPPTLEEINNFLADKSPTAYETLVDRLLASPRFGEHQARYWLDAARYGDTHGLHLDNERAMWLYRQWVIDALNKNKPFDQFTIEQIGGDLMPNPTLEQKIATGFNRCNVTTSEGGSIAEEYYVRYAVDRVETTSTVWMGMTLGCAVCHDHKFDPFSQREFYQLFAFFNSLTERPMDGNALLPPPILKAPTADQLAKQKTLEQKIADLEKQVKEALAKIEYTEPQKDPLPATPEPREVVWIDDELPAGANAQGNPATAGHAGPWQWVSAPEHPVFFGKKASRRSADGLSQHFFTDAKAGLKIGPGDKLFAYVFLNPDHPPKQIMLQFNDGAWEHRATWGEDLIPWGQKDSASRRAMGALPKAGEWVRLEVEADQVGLNPGQVITGWAFTQFDGTAYWDKAGLLTTTPQDGSQHDSLAVWEQLQRAVKKSTLPGPIQNILKLEADKRNPAQKTELLNYFLEHVHSDSRKIFDPLHKETEAAKKQLADLEKAVPGTLVMEEMPSPKDAFILTRGEYDKKGEKVTRGVPAVFPPLPKEAPINRLGLAQWLVSREHPLTARVTVNRYWQQYFGTGLVKTAEDFGSQGEWPSHPDLLDWLAVDFMESGWDVKRLHKLLVMSHTYRQSSKVRPEVHRVDVENRLLARGPRFRLDAEMIRDNALFVSGLLVEELGGKSVKPYQPPGLWEVVGYTDSNTAKFKRDTGEDLYRRSLYTFWKRTAPPPTMLTFDAPSRESCTVRRARTNTPLQALALLNDEQFMEAARHFGQRILQSGGKTQPERLSYAFRSVTAREPSARELEILDQVFQKHLKDFSADRESALKLLSVGESKRDETLDPTTWAAWTMIGNLLLNLDETITK